MVPLSQDPWAGSNANYRALHFDKLRPGKQPGYGKQPGGSRMRSNAQDNDFCSCMDQREAGGSTISGKKGKPKRV